jgi:hypothetical protein
MAAMQGQVGNLVAERHVQKYLNEKVINEHQFELACRHKVSKGVYIPAGEKIEVSCVAPVNGTYEALVNTSYGALSIPITKLHKPPIGRAKYSPESAEDFQIELLNQSIRDRVIENTFNRRDYTIPIVWGRKLIHVSGAKKVTELSADGRKPKADVYLHGNCGEPLLYGSLKMSDDTRKFQQWGGVSDYADHDAVQDFKERLLSYPIDPEHPFPRRFNVGFDLDPNLDYHLHLMKASMFGSEYASKQRGINNVDFIAGGRTTVVDTGHPKGLTFYAPLVILNNARFDPAEHPCHITARYASQGRNLGFKCCRIGVYPKGSRKVNVRL